jgi:hypothetical protein
LQLPFTHEQFLDAFAAFNTTWWLANLALWLLTTVAVIALARSQAPPRPLFLLLALHWAWSGAAYHLGYFAPVNPMARLFGVAFLLQAALFVGAALRREVPSMHWGPTPRQRLSLGFALYSLAYPLLIVATGFRWPRMPVAGVPCPTTLFTVAILLAVEPGRYRALVIVPVLWALVGSSAAIALGVVPDLALLPGALCLAAHAIAPRRLERRAG